MDKVEQVELLGFVSQQGEVPRAENPYHDLEVALPTDVLAHTLAEAWWRGWDDAALPAKQHG